MSECIWNNFQGYRWFAVFNWLILTCCWLGCKFCPVVSICVFFGYNVSPAFVVDFPFPSIISSADILSPPMSWKGITDEWTVVIYYHLQSIHPFLKALQCFFPIKSICLCILGTNLWLSRHFANSLRRVLLVQYVVHMFRPPPLWEPPGGNVVLSKRVFSIYCQ